MAQADNAALLARENELLRTQLAEHVETICDLRTRLDDSETERRRVQERLTGLLTHRPAGSVLPAGSLGSTEPRVPWWRWFQ